MADTQGEVNLTILIQYMSRLTGVKKKKKDLEKNDFAIRCYTGKICMILLLPSYLNSCYSSLSVNPITTKGLNILDLF